jgi:TfoX/Sxy family transcriptional regulator of competence genes
VKPSANEKHKQALDALLLGWPDVTAGKMFGYPAYFVNGKMFACVYGEGVGVKVSEELANTLLKNDNVVPFQPMGKPRMREWVQINRVRSEDYELDTPIFQASADFIRKITKK